MQRFGPVLGFKSGDFVECPGFAHELGEVVFEAGDAHVAGTGFQHVAYGTAYCADRRLAVESAEDVAGAEADQCAAHLWQHVCGEEGDGDGVAVFEVLPHGAGQVATHLFEPVSAVFA